MEPKKPKKFEYKGKTITIVELDEGLATMCYHYGVDMGFFMPGGDTIDEAAETAKRDIDEAEGSFCLP